MMRSLAAAAVAAALVAGDARARGGGDAQGFVLRYPSGDLPDAGALQAAMSDPSVSTIVFERGAHLFGATLYAFGRDDLTLRGATGRAADVVIESSATPAIQVEQALRTTLSDLTVRSTAAFGAAVRAASAISTAVESYADDVTIADCDLEGYLGVQADVRARNLVVAGCRVKVTQPGGAGVLWEDGSGLFLTRTRFATGAGVAGTAALFVRGAQSSASEGQRARRLLVTHNVVEGDFATGFDLADVADVRVRWNRIEFGSSAVVTGGGRIGIVVRRAEASALTEDWELFRNTVRRAHYGAWILNAGQGAVRANDFRGCASSAPDTRFADTGGALRINLQSSRCDVAIERNDMRDLRSPVADPAVVVKPEGAEAACFGAGAKNRLDRGRPLYLGAPAKGTR